MDIQKTYPLNKHLNEHQVSEITGLSVKTLQRYRHEFQGPNYLKLGRRVVYSAVELAAWLKAHEIDTQNT